MEGLMHKVGIVAYSAIEIGFNLSLFCGDIFLSSSCLLASMLLRDIFQISYISHLFSIRRFQTVDTDCKSRDDGADMQFRNSWTAKNPNQGLCNVL